MPCGGKGEQVVSVPDYLFQLNAVRRLARQYRVRVIGKSLCGRSIFALFRGSGAPCPLLAAGFHGMEYLTVLAALRFGQEYRGNSVCIVPCVNPDGTEIALHGAAAAGHWRGFVAATDAAPHWQANARGVDINHNFNADWKAVRRREREAGILRPAPTRFGGVRPESEPETRALTRLCRQTPFCRVLALHSQGREIYWDFGACTPCQSLPLAETMAAAGEYQTAAPEPLATGGGFKDWFIQAFHRCGFTVEMGMGKNPLPLADFPQEYPRVKAILDVFTGA